MPFFLTASLFVFTLFFCIAPGTGGLGFEDFMRKVQQTPGAFFHSACGCIYKFGSIWENTPMIKAVVFDYGKVISLDPADEAQEEMARLAGVPVEIFEKMRIAYRDDYDRGSIRGRAYYRQVMRESGVTVTDTRDFDALADRLTLLDARSWARINGETEALIRGIREAGYKVGILSNMSHDFLEYERDVLRAFDFCDACIFSCRYNLIKPEREIYQLLIDALGCAPEEIVFFDDLPVNVEGARNTGINAYQWKDAKTAHDTLKGLGILC
jgi:putative hydrolase of the HAD superfamily